ncbi:MgtC/SapB family protein [Streptomyces sp. NPDC001292]|uniref:MgtC/SapB family protein n=1 Tax=Streptomyces sp. NPDC001292 TaxID=3364558 RepID=UPI00368CED60
MANPTTFDVTLRPAAGFGCGALTSLDRRRRARRAGPRTDAPVACGATRFALSCAAVRDSGSPTRVASCVVSGTGFLGGGVTHREGGGVRGTGGGIVVATGRGQHDNGENTGPWAAVRLAGDPARGLERLVARPALERGVRDPQRRPDDAPLGTTRKAVAA